VPAVTVAPESHPEGVVPSAARLSPEHGEACGWRLVLTVLRLCREGSSRACYHRTLPQLFLQVSPWGCVAPSHQCCAERASAWPLGRIHLSLCRGETGLPSSPTDMCGSPQARSRSRTPGRPSARRYRNLCSSWTTRPRTYGRNTRVPTGEIPRTYGRNTAYLREKYRVPTGEITHHKGLLLRALWPPRL
jgi:hypothetical protein